MKVGEIRELPTEEIRKQLDETQRAFFNLRFRRQTEQLENPAEVRKTKKLIARLKTVLWERDLEAQPESSAAQT